MPQILRQLRPQDANPAAFTDAVISDLNMPNTSGLELCRRVHTQWPTLPVLLVTGFPRKEIAAAAVRAGAYEVITKPLQVDELLHTLARALSPKAL